MPVAIRAVTRIEDADDITGPFGAGQDGYAITWDNATGKFVMAAAATAPFVDSTAIVKGSSDATKLLRFEIDGFTSGATRVLTPPNQDGTIAVLERAQTWTANQSVYSEASQIINLDVAHYESNTSHYPEISARKSGGTKAVPGQTTNNMTLLRLAGYGFNSTDSTWYEGARIQFVSTGNWGGAGQGSADLVFSVKPNSSSTPNEAFRLVGTTGEVKISNIAASAAFALSSPFSRSTPLFTVSGTNSGGVDLVNTGVKFSPGCKTSGDKGTYLFEIADYNASTIYQLHGYGYSAQLLNDGRATASAVTNIYDLQKKLKSGSPGNGMGSAIRFGLQSSTTENQDAGRLVYKWTTATHASRQAQSDWTVYDYSAERTVISIGANGSAGTLGFYGVTPVARQTLATGAGASVDDVITALQNLGLVKQS